MSAKHGADAGFSTVGLVLYFRDCTNSDIVTGRAEVNCRRRDEVAWRRKSSTDICPHNVGDPIPNLKAAMAALGAR